MQNALRSGAGLVDATGEQEQRFARASGCWTRQSRARVSRGGAGRDPRRRVAGVEGFGRFTYEAGSPEVKRETVWDLASLTKAIATTSMAMLLWQRGALELDAEWLHGCRNLRSGERGAGQTGWREAVTVRMLLAHCSGLPAHRKLYLEAAGREAMLAAAMRVSLEAAPMERAEYSDIGFMVLGELLERIAGEGWTQFCRARSFFSAKRTL